jgi:hypothetical protein
MAAEKLPDRAPLGESAASPRRVNATAAAFARIPQLPSD